MIATVALLLVTLTSSDVARSLAFYDATLGALGLGRLQEFVDEEEPSDLPLEAVGFGRPEAAPVLWLVAGAVPTIGSHVALSARSRADVDRFFAAGVANGGTARQAPRSWEIYRRGYYGALLADPGGNLVEAVFDDADDRDVGLPD